MNLPHVQRPRANLTVIMGPRKYVSRIRGTPALEASHCLPLTVFPSKPPLAYIKQPKAPLASEVHHYQYSFEQNG